MSAATIGSALVEKRLELGLEKGQAADKIGMSRTTYSSYEQDAQRPSVDVFPALAEFLDVSMEELLTLYGATCVAAVRPSLEKVLSEGDGDVAEVPNVVEPPQRIEKVASTWSEEPKEINSEGFEDGHESGDSEGPTTGRDRHSHAHSSATYASQDISGAEAEAPTLSEPQQQLTPDIELPTQPEESTVVRSATPQLPASIFKREISDGTSTYDDHKKKKKKKKKKK